MNSHFYFQPSGTGNFLEGDPLLPAPDIDDSAAFKAVFRQGALHGQIVPMGIDAHIAALFKAPLQAEAPHTPGSIFAPLECIILTVNNDFMDAGGYAHEQLQ